MPRVVRVNTDLVVQDTLDGEVLAIRNDTGNYYSMTGTAADVWACILAGLPVEATAEVLASRYRADRAETEAAVGAFVQQLLDELLVVDGAGAVASVAPGPVDPRLEWAAPALEQYTDMQDLLLFDPIHEVRPEGWPNVAGPDA